MQLALVVALVELVPEQFAHPVGQLEHCASPSLEYCPLGQLLQELLVNTKLAKQVEQIWVPLGVVQFWQPVLQGAHVLFPPGDV